MNNGPHASRRRGGESADAAGDLIAIQALTFLGEDAARAERFMAVTGLSLDNLRQAAADPAFLDGVMDYVVADEPLLVAFSGANRLDAEAIVRAHEARRRRA